MKQRTWDCIICWRHFKRSTFEMAPAYIYTRVYLYHDIYVHTQFVFQCYFIFSFLIHSSSMHCINLYLSYQFLSVPLREEWIVWLQFFTYAKHIEYASLACFLFWHSVPGQLALAGVLTTHSRPWPYLLACFSFHMAVPVVAQAQRKAKGKSTPQEFPLKQNTTTWSDPLRPPWLDTSSLTMVYLSLSRMGKK